MIGVKEDCKHVLTLLTECAEKCDQYVRDLVPKHHCVKPAEMVVQMAKNRVVVFRDHLKDCDNFECSAVCHEGIKACLKAEEKCTAFIDVCMGAGTDEDAKIVCSDCAKACRDAMKACDDCLEKACS